MATNQTEHYSLNQWELTDSVIMAEFNADNQKLDAALSALDKRIDAAVADATQNLNASIATVTAIIPHVQVGTYVGTGESGADHPNVITTPFRPKFVLVFKEGADIYNGFDSENCNIFIDGLTGFKAHNSIGVDSHVTFSDTGVSWCHTGTTTTGIYQLNSEGVTYHYIAIG